MSNLADDPVVVALALGALLASLSSIVTSACKDMFDFEIFDLRDNIGNWTHAGHAGTWARRCLRETSRFIFLLYATSLLILIDLEVSSWIPRILGRFELTIEINEMISILNYLTMFLIGWILWLSAKVTSVRTRQEYGTSL